VSEERSRKGNKIRPEVSTMVKTTVGYTGMSLLRLAVTVDIEGVASDLGAYDFLINAK